MSPSSSRDTIFANNTHEISPALPLSIYLLTY